jgi:hypothetical protein
MTLYGGSTSSCHADVFLYVILAELNELVDEKQVFGSLYLIIFHTYTFRYTADEHSYSLKQPLVEEQPFCFEDSNEP